MIQLYIVPHTDSIGRISMDCRGFFKLRQQRSIYDLLVSSLCSMAAAAEETGRPRIHGCFRSSKLSLIGSVPFWNSSKICKCSSSVRMFTCSYISELSSWQLVQLDKDLQLVPYIQCFFVRRAGYSDLDSWWLTTFPSHCALIIRKSTINHLRRFQERWGDDQRISSKERWVCCMKR